MPPRALRQDEWCWSDEGERVRVTVPLPRSDDEAGAEPAAVEAKVSPQAFTLTIRREGEEERVLSVPETLNVVDPRQSEAHVDESTGVAVLLLAKWHDTGAWATLAAPTPAFVTHPRSPWKHPIAMDTAPPPSLLLGRLWIGGIGNLPGGREWFAEQGVTHVVSVCDFWPAPSVELEDSLVIDVADDAGTNLAAHFPAAARWIGAALRGSGAGPRGGGGGGGGCVYLHCRYGASRSATVALAYMLCLGWGLGDALAHCKRVRPAVSPIPAFLEQLQDFAGSLELGRLRAELGAAAGRL